jgi:methionyl-tRNA synthetase
MREIQFGHDGNFTNESLIGRINADLANDLGNLLSRTISMIKRYFDGRLPVEGLETDEDSDLKKTAEGLSEIVIDNIDNMHLPQALVEIFRLVSRANKYIDETMPWKLANDKDNYPRLATVLFNLCESLRFAAVLLSPFMPGTSPKIFKALHISEEYQTLESLKTFGIFPSEIEVEDTPLLFPRIDLEKELNELETLMKSKALPEKVTIKHENEIDYETFMSSELRVVKVIACEKVEKADKLLKFTVNDGERDRIILSGIAQWYSPEDVIGKKIAAVLNLKPAKIRGIMSEGMLLSSDIQSSEGETASLVFIDDSVPEGSRIR